MARLVSLVLLTALASSQYAALSCPMELPVTEMSEAGQHSHHDGAHAGDERRSDRHDDGPSCMILMSCGSVAVSISPPQGEPVRVETRDLTPLPVASLQSLSRDIESPPPRRG